MLDRRALEVELNCSLEDMILDGLERLREVADSERDEPNPFLWQIFGRNVVIEHYAVEVDIWEQPVLTIQRTLACSQRGIRYGSVVLPVLALHRH